MKYKATYLALAGLLLVSQSSYAEFWAEREALANIEIELTSQLFLKEWRELLLS